MDSTALDTIAPPRFETGKAMLVAGVGERFSYDKRRRHSRLWRASIKCRRPSRAGSARSPTASAATATMPAISTTSPVSRSPTSPTCRANSAGPHSRAALCRVHPRRPHLDHPPHHQHDLESLAAGLGPEGGRRAELRALRREIRSRDRQWRSRDLGARSRSSFATQPCASPRACLASAGALCHNSGNKLPARDRPPAATKAGGFFMANIRVLATDLEFPEGPVVMPDGSVVLVEIRGQAADPGLSRRPQGGRRADSGRAERRGARARRQDVHLQQWRLHLDPDPQHDHAGSAARGLSRRLDPARRSAERQGRDRRRPSAASMRCAGRTISCSTGTAACGSPISASAAPATWMSARSITSSPA